MSAEFAQFNFHKSLSAAPERVFTALTSAADRMAWGTPDTSTVLLIDGQPDPAPGVREVGKIGPRENPYVDVATDWVVMNAPNLLLYAETLSAEGEALGTSLATGELSSEGTGTALKATVQLVNFAGEEMRDEIENGWTHAMEALAEHCQTVSA